MKLVLATIIVIYIQLLICGIGGAPCSPNFEQGKRSSKRSSKPITLEQSAVPEHHDIRSSSKDGSIPVGIGPTETKVTTFEEFSQGPHIAVRHQL